MFLQCSAGVTPVNCWLYTQQLVWQITSLSYLPPVISLFSSLLIKWIFDRCFDNDDGHWPSPQVRAWRRTCWTGCWLRLVSRVTWTWSDCWSTATMLMSKTVPSTAMSLLSSLGCHCTLLHEQVGRPSNNLTISHKIISFMPLCRTLMFVFLLTVLQVWQWRTLRYSI